MKGRTLQFIFSIVFLTFALPTFADQTIRIGESGTTKITVKLNAGESTSYNTEGNTFKVVTFSVRGNDMRYSLKRGRKLLSSGLADGSKIKLKSDGKSTYTLKLINTSTKVGEVTISFTKTGGGSDI